MPTSWNFYALTDSALTTPAVGGVSIPTTAASVDRVLRFGSPVAGKTLQAASAPGVDPVQILPADVAPGSGIQASAIKLALSSAGLETAVAGAPLTVGTTLQSGADNAVVIYVRTSRGALGVGSYPDLSITTNGVIES